MRYYYYYKCSAVITVSCVLNMLSLCDSVASSRGQDGDNHLFNYRKLTRTLFDVFCFQGEKGDVGNVGKIGSQVSLNLQD